MNIKKQLIIYSLLAAILGSALTLGVSRFLFLPSYTGGSATKDSQDYIHLANRIDSLPISSVDFVTASSKSIETVVHIKSSVVISNNYNNYQFDPFREFFNDDFFGPRHFYRQPQKRERVQQSSGSGVIINNEGYIVTNNHVVNNAREVEVTLYDNRSYKAEVIGTDPSTDIALIKIDADELPHIKFADSDQVQVGEWVLAVGNPFNLSSTVTAGIVSAKGRNINILKDKSAIESFIQTDAAVNPGNSGGALVNLNGDLIGINTAIATPTGTYAGYAFAVPSNIVAKVVDDLIDYGIVQRAYLGIEIRDLSSELAQEENIDRTKGVYVAGVIKDGAAAESGIEIGDVIIAVNEAPVSQSSELLEQIGRHRPGDRVTIKLIRDGQEKNFVVELKNKVGKAEVIDSNEAIVAEQLGAEFEALSSREKEKLGLSNGVKISQLNDGKLRQQTSIKEGFIVLKVNRQLVYSPEDVLTEVSKSQGGVMFEGIYPDSPIIYYYAFGL